MKICSAGTKMLHVDKHEKAKNCFITSVNFSNVCNSISYKTETEKNKKITIHITTHTLLLKPKRPQIYVEAYAF
jgi:hypothetical protein